MAGMNKEKRKRQPCKRVYEPALQHYIKKTALADIPYIRPAHRRNFLERRPVLTRLSLIQQTISFSFLTSVCWLLRDEEGSLVAISFSFLLATRRRILPGVFFYYCPRHESLIKRARVSIHLAALPFSLDSSQILIYKRELLPAFLYSLRNRPGIHPSVSI